MLLIKREFIFKTQGEWDSETTPMEPITKTYYQLKNKGGYLNREAAWVESSRPKKVEVQGIDADIFVARECDLHDSPHYRTFYVVCEGRTGMLIAGNTKMKDAIAEAKERLLKVGQDKLDETIGVSIKRFGLSPRYGGEGGEA